LQEGEGSETPCDGCTVSLHYTGTLVDGTKFDSSLERNEPFEFSLGKGQVIRAFDMGVATMRKGEKCMLTCGPTYAYGAAGSPPNIPPNSTLKFELEMLSWKGQDLSKDGDGGIERFIVTKSEKKKTPNDGAFVKCHIIGRLEGKVIEERDIEFNIGEGEEFGVISGVETALEKMSQGETSRLVIKPKYAFGSEGNEQLQVPANAMVEYTVTLNEFEKAVESWKLDKEESLEQGKIFKEKGTKYFKQEKFRMALKFYEKCHSFLSNCGELTKPHLVIRWNSAIV
jgi:FK506-binding protein 4/5